MKCIILAMIVLIFMLNACSESVLNISDWAEKVDLYCYCSSDSNADLIYDIDSISGYYRCETPIQMSPDVLVATLSPIKTTSSQLIILQLQSFFQNEIVDNSKISVDDTDARIFLRFSGNLDTAYYCINNNFIEAGERGAYSVYKYRVSPLYKVKQIMGVEFVNCIEGFSH